MTTPATSGHASSSGATADSPTPRRVPWLIAAPFAALAAISCIALAVTAWTPGGLPVGMRTASRPASFLLAAACAYGLLLAGAVLWQFRPFPRAVRAGLAALACYGVVAFVSAFRAGSPFASLFSGGGFWMPLPGVLQGAYLAGFVVLPLALLVSIVRAGIPRLRDGSPWWRLYQALSLATCLALVVAALPAASGRSGAERASQIATGFRVPDITPPVPSPALSDALDHALRAVADGEQLSPRDRWDPDYVVEQVGKDPERLRAWVAGQTTWVPYRGSLRGAVGVLMDRAGNSLDRALLLGALLGHAGHTVRLAHGRLTYEEAVALLPGLIVDRARATLRSNEANPLSAEDVQEIVGGYGLDGPKIERSLAASAGQRDTVLPSLAAQALEQSTRLRAGLTGLANTQESHGSRIDDAIEQLQDHWWVERRDGTSWIGLDVMPPGTATIASATETMGIDELPPSERQQVIVRVVSEQWRNGSLSERVALDKALVPSELVGTPILLRFWPRRWPGRIVPGPNPSQYIRTTALAQKEWLATVQIGRKTAAQVSLVETGAVNEHPAVNDAAILAGGAASAAGDVANMLSGIAPGQTQTVDSDAPVLTAAWLEFEIVVPGAAPRITRHTVFDLVGPAARAARRVPRPALDDAQRLRRALALMMETEILPMAGRIAPEYHRHLVATGLLANRELLHAAMRGEITTDMRPQDLSDRFSPMPGALYQLALTRFEQSPVGRDVFLASPNVLTRHVFLESLGGAAIALRDAVDIVANDVAVELGVKDAFDARFVQGVFDTNAEAALPRGATPAVGAANAFALSRDWVTIAPADRTAVEKLQLSEDERARLAQDLSGGSMVVVPAGPVSVGTARFVGWWRIDPNSGTVLGVDTRGWGSAATDYMILTSAMIGFEMGFVMCEVPPPSLADPPVARWDRTGVDWIVAPVEAVSKQCLVEGVISAVVAGVAGLAFAKFGGEAGAEAASASRAGAAGRGAGAAGSGAGGAAGEAGAAGAAGESGAAGAAAEAGEAGGAAGRGGQYRGPGGAPHEEGLDSLGKTQPGVQPAPKTVPGPPPEMEAPAGPGAPKTVAAAEDAAETAGKESTQATRDYVNHRAMKPNPGRGHAGDPESYNPDMDKALEGEMLKKEQAALDALEQLRIVRQTPVNKGGGFPPPQAPKPQGLPGCPPNCGNDNKTLPPLDLQAPGSSRSSVGAVGVAGVLGGQ